MQEIHYETPSMAAIEKQFFVAGDREEEMKKMQAALSEVEARPETTVNQVRRVKIGRNDPCPCGSGSKFKRCCINKAR
jgi:uncharacterized protein YecA (UPF0149 family)